MTESLVYSGELKLSGVKPMQFECSAIVKGELPFTKTGLPWILGPASKRDDEYVAFHRIDKVQIDENGHEISLSPVDEWW